MVQVVVRTGKSGLASWPRQQPNASVRGHLRLSTVGALQPSPRQPQRQGPMDPGQPVNSKTPSSKPDYALGEIAGSFHPCSNPVVVEVTLGSTPPRVFFVYSAPAMLSRTSFASIPSRRVSLPFHSRTNRLSFFRPSRSNPA